MTGTYRPEDLIYLADGPRQGGTVLAPGQAGAVCLSPVSGEVPRVGMELLYADTGERTATGMRIYRLVVAGRPGDGGVRASAD